MQINAKIRKPNQSKKFAQVHREEFQSGKLLFKILQIFLSASLVTKNQFCKVASCLFTGTRHKTDKVGIFQDQKIKIYIEKAIYGRMKA